MPVLSVLRDDSRNARGMNRNRRPGSGIGPSVIILAPSRRRREVPAIRPWLAATFSVLLGWGPALADCAGPPYDQFDFWLGTWHDPASPPTEHYAARRTAGGCAIEEVQTGGNGQIQGIGLAGWDNERKQWRQLWAVKDKIVTVYLGGPVADGTVVLISEPKGDGTRWRYTYRNIRPDGVDADYASRRGDGGPWTSVWSGHFDRIGPVINSHSRRQPGRPPRDP